MIDMVHTYGTLAKDNQPSHILARQSLGCSAVNKLRVPADVRVEELSLAL